MAIVLSAAVIFVIVLWVAAREPAHRPGPDGASHETSQDHAMSPSSGDTSATSAGTQLPMIDDDAQEATKIAAEEAGIFVVINKGSHKLTVFRDGRLVKSYGVAVGKNTGDKQKVGDMRTPLGKFPISQIQSASSWTHDFRDGKGQIKGAYGPLFIRLSTPPWSGIGIHGTHNPASIGTNVTEGCIRLKNEDLLELRKLVKVGDKVLIRE